MAKQWTLKHSEPVRPLIDRDQDNMDIKQHRLRNVTAYSAWRDARTFNPGVC